MGRGRKPMVNSLNNWQGVFYNSVGSYVQIINLELAKTIDAEPLSTHIRIAGGFAFKSSSYVSEGVPVIRISDFNNEKIILEDVKYYKESDDLKKYELFAGDIVIALTGGTIAKLGIVQKGIGKLYLNQRVGKFEVLNPDEFEAEYVYWIARSVQSIIKQLAWGAAIPNVSPKDIEKLKFPIPDRNTQKGIISFLNDLKNNSLEEKPYFNIEIEEKIVTTHQNQVDGGALSTELTHQLNLVKQLRQAFLREAMQGKLVPQDPNDEPASVLLEKIKAEKERLVKAKKLKKQNPLPTIKENEIPFEIPENWEWCRLGEILEEIKYGTSQSCDYDSLKNSKVLRIPNVSGGILNGEDIKYTNLSPKEQSELSLRENDILIIRSNGSRELVGKTVLVTYGFVGFAYAGYLVRFRFNQNLSNPKYLWLLSTAPFFREQIERPLRTTVGINNINTQEMSNLLVPIPPISEQIRIVAKLDELMQYCDELEASIKESQQQNELLLQQVLREALEPKEKEVENVK